MNVIEATIAGLKADAGILLSSVPVMNERLDQLPTLDKRGVPASGQIAP